MSGAERRRAERLAVDMRGRLLLSGERSVDIRIRNIGSMGALATISDLEAPVFEGERALLEHPPLEGEMAGQAPPGVRVSETLVRTVGSVVRVELDFQEDGVTRVLAVFFDGGPAPDGWSVPEGEEGSASSEA